MSAVQIIPFHFESSEVRALTVNGSPWFVAADVCGVLQLSNPTMAIESLDDDERAKLNLGLPGGATNVISESGLYVLVLRCRDAIKPGTVPYRFRKWVTSEVLPAIRKTGCYVAPGGILYPDGNEAELLAFTRQGERLARELEISVKVARALGVKGRRQVLERAREIGRERHGVDCLAYFNIDLEKLFPRIENSGGEDLITRFLSDECEIDDEAERIRSRELYRRFCSWYAERVDHRLRGLPPQRAVTVAARRLGVISEKRGGVYWLRGVRLIGSAEVH